MLYSSVKHVMYIKNPGLAELSTNMKERLGDKAVIEFAYRTVMLFSRFIMFINVYFMSGI